MKPYFQRDGITLYHGDCREILPTLGRFDAVVTDPPYGIDYQSAWRAGWQRKDKIQGDSEFPLWMFELIVPPRIAMFVWCRWDTLRIMPPPKSFIVWDKGCHSMGDLEHEFGRQWEACAFYPGDEHAFVNRPIDIIRTPRIQPNLLAHPNEKPVAAILPLINCHRLKNLVDPFAGSGSTLLAAKLCGVPAVGIEIEERYCALAAERLSQRVIAFGEPQEKEAPATRSLFNEAHGLHERTP